VALDWFERHVVKNGLRSERKMGALLKKVIIPPFAAMEFVDVRRKHITALLDKIEDKHGVRQSDYALSILSGICGWYAKRDEDYASPIIRGMKRQKKNDRDRVLTDSEIRTIWNEAEELLGNFTKLALLTGQRREKLLTMRYDDLRNGVWYIKSEAREKGNGEELRLPTMALEILEKQRVICPGPRVFDCPITRLRNHKLRFDRRHKLQPWWFHDLRRTARTLMAAAGVQDVVAELVLGHVQRGVQAVYNRHAYFEEKADALEKLAARLTDIVYERKAA
jgi:integrase